MSLGFPSSVGIQEQVLRNLQDRSMEKKSQAARDIQHQIEDLAQRGDNEKITKIITAFTQWTKTDVQSLQRRTGLFALSIIAVGLYQHQRKHHDNFGIVKTITYCLQDKDQKVQLAACEAIFNILKTYRETVLQSEHFIKIFDEIILLISNPSQDVREYAKKVDSKMKDIVFMCLNTNNVSFNLDQLIDNVCKQFETKEERDAPMVLIEWIEHLHSIPNVNVIKCVPRFIVKLLVKIQSQELHDVRDERIDLGKKALEQLKLFLDDFEQMPASRNLYLDRDVIQKLIEFLTQFKRQGIAFQMALNWLNMFIQFFLEDFNRVIAENQRAQQIQQEKAIQEESKDQLIEEVKEVQHQERESQSSQRQPFYLGDKQKKLLKECYTELFPNIIKVILDFYSSFNHKETNMNECKAIVDQVSTKLLFLVIEILEDNHEFKYIFKKLKQEFKNEAKPQTKEIIIMWYTDLFKSFHEDLIDQHQEVFENLIDTLEFSQNTLVKKVMELVCMLSTKNEKYLREVMEKLILKFHMQRTTVSQENMIQVIQVLCNSIQPEKVFMEFAGLLEDTDDLIFCQELIETLTLAIAASPFYKTLRDKLVGKQPTMFAKNKEQLFFSLYKTWCYNPISTLTLCLLSRNYVLAYSLIPRFTMIDMDTHKLIALGNLVHLIESPSFINLRIELTRQTTETKYLVKTLQGILMILPLSKSFESLKKRLSCVKLAQFEVEEQDQLDPKFFGSKHDLSAEMETQNCLNIFDEKQAKAEKYVHDQEAKRAAAAEEEARPSFFNMMKH